MRGKKMSFAFLSAVSLCGLAVGGESSLTAKDAAAKAQERHECTQERLEGGYGYVLTGYIVDVGPVAAVGLAIFDGQGGLSARETVSTNGEIALRAGTGSYFVNGSNCTGYAMIGEFTFDFMIVPGTGGAELTFIATHPGTVQTGVFSKTGDEECTLASLRGTYRVLNDHGMRIGTGPTANVGFRILDGAGHLTVAEDTSSVNGVITHRLGRPAAYTVNADCTVNEVFEDGATFDGVIVAGGSEAFFLRTNTEPSSVTTALYKKKSRDHEDD